MLIGIDLGTTALKVAAYDAKTGNRLAGEERRLKIDSDGDGRREQSPSSVLKSLQSALKALGTALGGLDGVRGVGVASQGGSGIVAERETGSALTPMVLWNDGRAFSVYPSIAAKKSTRFWRAHTRRDEPGMGLARLSQIRAQSPSLLSAGNVYAGAGDFLYFHLTGKWRQDACHALQTGCYDAARDRLSSALCSMAGVDPGFFPPLREEHALHPLTEQAAGYFGLPQGIPVAGPYMDHEAGFLSTAQISKRPLQCSLGTAWVGNFQLSPEFDGYASIQFSIPAPATEGRLVIHPLLTGNVTWDWALQTFLGGTPAKALKRQAMVLDERLLPENGLVAVPWLNRPNPLDGERLGGCTVAGAGPSTTREDLLRAVLAGMGYELHRVFGALAEQGAVDSLVLSGGTSQSVHVQALIGALFEPLPIYLLEEPAWMGTRGCLWAFGKRVARAKAARVRPACAIDRNALALGRRLYLEAFERLYRHCDVGTAYTIRRRKRA